MRRFEHPLSLVPQFTGLRFYTFPRRLRHLPLQVRARRIPRAGPAPPTARSHSSPGRRWTRKQLIPGARSAAGSLRQAAASPVKLGLLFGGSALITLAYIAALDASVQAFGAGPGLIVLGAVYLGAAALAAAAPTPGGLGAIEAALVAGLTGVGMQPGPAVSAVLLYRLATYWLPVLPGWLSWRSLQHRGYV